MREMRRTSESIRALILVDVKAYECRCRNSPRQDVVDIGFYLFLSTLSWYILGPHDRLSSRLYLVDIVPFNSDPILPHLIASHLPLARSCFWGRNLMPDAYP